MSEQRIIYWFRRDLRLADNSALGAARATGAAILPVFIIDPRLQTGRFASRNRMAFLLRALASLDEQLRARGGRLLARYGLPHEVLPSLIKTVGASALYFNRDDSPFARQRDARVCREAGIPVVSFHDSQLVEAMSLLRDNGEPYRVFTPYFRRWLTIEKRPPVSESQAIRRFFRLADKDSRGILQRALTETAADATLPAASETAAQSRLRAFIDLRIADYDRQRNALTRDPLRPDATSILSIDLRMGLLSPRQLYWAARTRAKSAACQDKRTGIASWIRQLAWRDFFAQILYHYPQALRRSFRPQYEELAWRNVPAELAAWQAGQTGYPIVDAAMRQLSATGWMPNRARMIVASFLCKHLLHHWREGEAHFMRHLLDGDPAANNGGWQWAAGTGCDAQPWFRIFNPVLQSRKFDAAGLYIRHWLPELREIPDKFIHQPWRMDDAPVAYPPPLVDLQLGRDRALAAFKAATSSAG
ncbi:MAG: deoxyribodipyrimidine photo-lyase [Chloroflexi bacterium]|nr:deoxyribodipyrimidine photo-lyase [Chloroflexota bacterium]MCY4246675.1 deoxyribodipyrimidine photo-lyase [Chloroflexota bacterium]